MKRIIFINRGYSTAKRCILNEFFFDRKQKGVLSALCVVCLLLSGIFYSCTNKIKDSEDYLYCLTCTEKRDVIETLKDEPGYITYRTDPAIDRVCYYYFEPSTPKNKFSERLHFWTTVGSPDVNLDKYVFPYKVIKVEISGNVTDSLSLHREWREDCDCGLITREFNILEVSSIKIVKNK